MANWQVWCYLPSCRALPPIDWY